MRPENMYEKNVRTGGRKELVGDDRCSLEKRRGLNEGTGGDEGRGGGLECIKV